nr:reverse transcriptase domain-containing protein [Tanacetum cinerariifolium]
MDSCWTCGNPFHSYENCPEEIASRKERVPKTYDYRSQYNVHEYDTYHSNYNIEMEDDTMYRSEYGAQYFYPSSYEQGLRQMPIMLTTRGALSQDRNWDVMSVEFKDISGENTVGHEAAYRMSWKTLMKMMTNKYCPRNEIRKLEMELWDLKVKGTNLASYTQRFQELALLCGRMFSGESDKVEKYVGGLPDMIYGSRAKGNLRIRQDPLETNNNNSNNTRTKGRTLAEFTPQHLVERSNMGDPNPYALNAIITTMVHVLLSATTATNLVILQATVGMWQIPIMLTIRGALGQDRSRDAMSVEFKELLEENVPS